MTNRNVLSAIHNVIHKEQEGLLLFKKKMTQSKIVFIYVSTPAGVF